MKPFNYISIPKTGSQSIHQYLNIDLSYNHCSIYVYENKYLFSFSFIREPIDRLLSWFTWHKMTKIYPTTPSVYNCSFDEWVSDGCKCHWTEGELKFLGISSPLHQYEFVCKNGMVDVDFLGDFSCIVYQFPNICNEIGFASAVPLNTFGKSDRYDIDISEETIEKIKKLFHNDFLLYEKINQSGSLTKGFKVF